MSTDLLAPSLMWCTAPPELVLFWLGIQFVSSRYSMIIRNLILFFDREPCVTGTFTVPSPSGSAGSAASAWVGIDGDTCQNAILQTGVDGSYGGEHRQIHRSELIFIVRC
ncbi:hypothetical protein L210DRAFT_3530901 [Boletus edulis BED1]|uniref:Uncharacterized protein n=1 Tax=Boletus edulis BED1 TaxID=1328754 RepID=A0AAD4GHM9_BOLED|nr:hypothetical protein L210DRAFT_3530901 [Boletus edulis BED1]